MTVLYAHEDLNKTLQRFSAVQYNIINDIESRIDGSTYLLLDTALFAPYAASMSAVRIRFDDRINIILHISWLLF